MKTIILTDEQADWLLNLLTIGTDGWEETNKRGKGFANRIAKKLE